MYFSVSVSFIVLQVQAVSLGQFEDAVARMSLAQHALVLRLGGVRRTRHKIDDEQRTEQTEADNAGSLSQRFNIGFVRFSLYRGQFF